MVIEKKIVWVVMSKDRKYIGKGTKGSRELVAVDDKKDTKRLITFSSEGKARYLCDSYFRGYENICDFNDDYRKYLEPVKCELTLDMLT